MTTTQDPDSAGATHLTTRIVGSGGREAFDLAHGTTAEMILLPAKGVDEPMESPTGELFAKLHRLSVDEGARWFQIAERSEVGTPDWLLPVPVPDDAHLELVASAWPTGPKLVIVTPELRRAVRFDSRLVTFAPNCRYRTVSAHPGPVPSPIDGASETLPVEVVDAATNDPVANAVVEVFEDVRHALGDSGASDGTGSLSLRVSGLPLLIERLYVEPPSAGYWGCYREWVRISPEQTLQLPLEPIAAEYIDAARHVYQPSIAAGTGVRIAVVDHGVDGSVVPLAGGRNLVLGEPDDDYGDDGTGHGTHIAGVIANTATGGPQGIAPEAEIFSYRIFGPGKETTSFEVTMAVRTATDDECHLVNLSIGGFEYDETLRRVDEWAASKGVLMLAAAGNDWGGAVNLPAALPNTLAVAAMGRIGTFPAGSLEEAHIGPRSAIDRDDFLASFTSVQPDDAIDVIAPGVGILSVRPGGGHGPLSGTSQACAVATGAAARALSGTPWLTDAADEARWLAMRNHLVNNASSVGLTLAQEGAGLLT